jgi:hypothetical protein
VSSGKDVSSTMSMTAAGSRALPGGTFGYMSNYASNKVTWPDNCNFCSSPYDMCDTSTAFLQDPTLRSSMCPDPSALACTSR